jgi:hypothetical protein
VVELIVVVGSRQIWTVNMDADDYDHGKNDVVLRAIMCYGYDYWMVMGSSTSTDNDKWLRKTVYMYMIL